MSENDHASGGSIKGPLAWMVRNAVAANMLMLVVLAGGLVMLPSIKKEVFPEFDLDLVLVSVAYPGASPEEVEQGVSLAVEEAVRGIDGVKEVRSTNQEGFATIAVDLLLGTDADEAMNQVQAAVNRVTSLPENAERPVVFRASNKNEVVSLVIYGDADEKALRALAEEAREGLLRDPRITEVELLGVRPPEVSIEVPQRNLRQYGFTLGKLAQAVRAASVELPGGAVKTKGGEVLLRTMERRRGSEFAGITVLSMPDGTEVKIGDIASVVDGFAETDQVATFNGKPAVMVKVFRTGSQTPIDVSAAVDAYIENEGHRLPPGFELASWLDMSEFYEQRADLLITNAMIGLVLVLVILGLFLEIRLAFWVTLGIPISFIGSLVFLPSADVSINMISMFAFILVLGMVVDDAIIIGEEIYKRRQEGMSRMRAAIVGVHTVAGPVAFAILTTIIFYMPLLFVPGPAGKFFRVIPIVVIATLIISLVESILILPAHLAHGKRPAPTGIFGWISARQATVSGALEGFITRVYVPVATKATKYRYATFAIGLAMLIGSCGVMAGGRIGTIFLPKVENIVVQAQVTMPFGTPIERTRAVRDRLIADSQAIIDENGGYAKVSRGVFALTGQFTQRPGNPQGGVGISGSHLTEVSIYLVESDDRPISAEQFALELRERMKNVAGVDKLRLYYSTGPSQGLSMALDLSHSQLDVLKLGAEDLAVKLNSYAGLFDIDDGFEEGKEQLDFRLKPEARALGITELELASQVRGAFFGAEAVRQQRGRDEVKVYVRLPRSERESEYNVENLTIITPDGGEIPIEQAAEITRGRSSTVIRRRDGIRIVTAGADADLSVANPGDVISDLQENFFPGLVEKYPGLTWAVSGQQKEQADMMSALARGFVFALLAGFGVLAVAFRSYIQPLIILMVIPFGFVGALWGHMALGYDLSMMSWMGVVALAGVVVNDSLILVVAVNHYRAEGMPLHEAVVTGGARRFRPILLTSLTTFFGLVPMILETSVQAKFLVPMAVSLGFGVLFATFITLLLVPATYMILDDIRMAANRYLHD